ncbi:hypothetical protein HDU87_002251 [Geranomyces variabilis]|uniref:Uncharacterized protein n=1 Tax=Geranomyces variabilis TaxID=109894 RepID=A0AAD5XNC4_9FUNG|nr:hypothetical protein HDU87_002251 [Geranomyces variabilis]
MSNASGAREMYAISMPIGSAGSNWTWVRETEAKGRSPGGSSRDMGGGLEMWAKDGHGRSTGINNLAPDLSAGLVAGAYLCTCGSTPSAWLVGDDVCGQGGPKIPAVRPDTTEKNYEGHLKNVEWRSAVAERLAAAVLINTEIFNYLRKGDDVEDRKGVARKDIPYPLVHKHLKMNVFMRSLNVRLSLPTTTLLRKILWLLLRLKILKTLLPVAKSHGLKFTFVNARNSSTVHNANPKAVVPDEDYYLSWCRPFAQERTRLEHAGTVRRRRGGHLGARAQEKSDEHDEEKDKTVVVVPILMPANTDARHYWQLTRHISRYVPVRSDKCFGMHAVNERIAIFEFIGPFAFFHALIRNFQDLRK